MQEDLERHQEHSKSIRSYSKKEYLDRKCTIHNVESDESRVEFSFFFSFSHWIDETFNP
jgi:hypothetical protein